MLYFCLRRAPKGAAVLVVQAALVLLAFVVWPAASHAQNNVGIGTTTPSASAVLDLTSTSLGFLVPRMTTVQKLAIASPTTGLLVYDNTLNTFYYYNGAAWVPFLSSSSGWLTTGNAGTTAGTNFLGTTDAVDMVFKTNSTEWMRLTSGGNFGIGTTAAGQKLEVVGNVKIDASAGVASQLQFQNPAGTFNTTFAAGAQGANIAYTLPTAQGAANTVLTNNGAGVLSWASASSAGTAWQLLGNAGTVASTNFLGTTDLIDLRFRTNNVERVAITTAGLVGIGINAPLAKLHVYDGNQAVGATSNVEIMTSDAEGVDVGGSLGLGGNRTAASPATFAQLSGRKENATSAGNEGYMQFATLNGSNVMLEGMRINSSQDVSIGSAQSGTAATSAAKLSVTQTATSTQKALLVTQNGSALSGNTQYATYSVATGAGSNNVAGYFSATNAVTANYGLLVAAGLVGINTTAPTQQLEVVGNVKIDATGGVASQLQFQNPAATFNTTFAAGAQVANIAYTLPTAQGAANTVLTNNGAGVLSWGAVSTSATAWQLLGNSGTNAATNFIGTTDAIDWVMRTNNIERARITSSGNFGIGTAAASQKLEVVGNAKLTASGGVASQLQFQNPAGTFNTTFAAGAQAANIPYVLPTAQGAAATYLQNDGAGNLSWAAASGAATSWALLGNTGTVATTNFIGTTDAVDWVMRTNNVERARISSAGFFGIGTNAPTSTLHTVASGAKVANFTGNLLTNTATSSTASVNKYGLQVSSTGLWNGTSAINDGLDVAVSGGTTNYAATFNGGNVGIGTSTPTQLLEVVGNEKLTATGGVASQLQFQNPAGTFTSTFAAGAQVANIAYTLPTAQGAANTVLTNNGAGALSWAAPVTSATAWQLLGNAGTVATTNFIGTTDAVDWVMRTNNVERARITSGGNFGIGTAAASQKLEVVGNEKLTATGGVASQLQFQNPAGTFTSTFAAGAQGANIAYTLPTAQGAANTVLTNNGAGTLSWAAPVTSGTAWQLLGNAGTVASTNFLGTTDAVDLVFRTNNTEKVRVMSGGNVGINTAAPTQKLEVKNGNVLLSNSGTADTLIFSTPNSAVYSSFVARAQTNSAGTAASIQYTLPDTLASDDAELAMSNGSGIMRWRADHHYNINAVSIVGTQNALAVPATGTFFLVTGSATPVVNGIAANASMDGRMIMLSNIGATSITITDNSGTGAAKIHRYTGAGNLTLVQYMTITLVYDATNGYWHSLF